MGEGRRLADKISPEAAELAKAASLSDAEVERLVAEHSQARKARDFARSDAIRAVWPKTASSWKTRKTA